MPLYITRHEPGSVVAVPRICGRSSFQLVRAAVTIGDKSDWTSGATPCSSYGMYILVKNMFEKHVRLMSAVADVSGGAFGFQDSVSPYAR